MGIVGVILALAVGMGVLLLVMGLGKRFAREVVPALVDLPGGAWAVGGGLGVVTALGVTGWLRCASGVSGGSRLTRGLNAAGAAICCAAAFGPFFLLISGLPGRNCRSETCAYIPGTGSALLAYALSAGLVGWIVHRWTSARAAARATLERERVRRLRKKGKGRAARRR
ncbi:hypothetical protein [Streptomyces cahuitamycinicus]|uniref:Uncharacterized protein n=1 Tax=Streptomyces cahuitamycinicus TaxID=2070367 RepID=A0A2N8TPG3_9ACTN|nr:hypothetical protein [Streptomyces cahuitamycinicus]PNG20891.1 hypothetical protein C1J00_17780 [Streptomyces cahuitamycinicus]